jgi:hypothetical protein
MNILETYLQVSHELCEGREWTLHGIGEPLQRFAQLVRAQALDEAAGIAEEELANSNALAAYNTVQRIRALAKETT